MKPLILLAALLSAALPCAAESNRTGRVVFYRLKFAVMSTPIDSAAVFIDGEKIAVLHTHRRFTIDLPAGKHELRSDSKDLPIVLDVQPGSVHYVREDYNMAVTSFPSGAKILIEVPAETGKAQLEHTKTATRGEILKWDGVVEPASK